MNKIELVIKEKGRYVEIPGISAFRTPAKVDVTKVKLSVLIQSLHSCGVNNYELASSDEKGEVKTYTKDELSFLENKKKDGEIGNRLDRLEDLLLRLISKESSQKVNSSEQITNRLNRIERMIRQGVRVYETNEFTESPVIEELEDRYIPEINVSEMQISGKTTEVVEKTLKDDIDAAADMLSNLRKKDD